MFSDVLRFSPNLARVKMQAESSVSRGCCIKHHQARTRIAPVLSQNEASEADSVFSNVVGLVVFAKVS